jgi:hypothetical protein
MADYGFKISKDGFDVKTATIDQLVLTTKAQQYKISSQGSVSFTSPNQTINVAHGLSYTPAYIAFQKVSGNTYYNWQDASKDYVDGTNLSLFGSTGDVISYIIFKDIGA